MKSGKRSENLKQNGIQEGYRSMKKQILRVFMVLALFTALPGCGSRQVQNAFADTTSSTAAVGTNAAETNAAETNAAEITKAGEAKEKMLRMMIGDTAVAVDWENNESVEALKNLCAETPLVIQMSMYGGFEQVGPVGTRLPSSDVQTRTSAGDIVLYSSSQIVVFYGSNSWAYTRLGHIEGKSRDELRDMLGSNNVVLTITSD